MRTNVFDENTDDYLSSIAKIPVLSKDEELQLLLQAKSNQKSMDKLVKHNLKLVVSVAKHYCNTGVPFMDLIQEGNIGLIEAIKNFDTTRGVKFSTYATHYIYNFIRKGIAKHLNAIRIPPNTVVLIQRYRKEYSKFYAEYGHKPTMNDMAIRLKITVKQLQTVMGCMHNDYFVSTDKVIAKGDNAYLGNELTLGEIIEDDYEHTTEYHGHQECLKEDLKRVINVLPIKQQIMLIHKYGLFGAKPKSCKTIADMLGVHYKYVFRLERQAWDTIRELNKKENISEYIE